MTSSNNPINKKERLFRRLALLTVLAVYLLILAGGIVRSTGSGMGCPDWPRCFGRWVPPTEVSQLPTNYQEIYGAKLKGEVLFNPLKTWIEYVNRLLGAFSGLLVFATLLAAIPYLRKDKVVFYGSLLSLILIGLNGWLGSRVVATELAPWMVTLHMLLAIAVVFALLYVTARSYRDQVITSIGKAKKQVLNSILLITILVSLIQVLLGTQVRESLDEVIQRLGYEERYRWIESLDYRFYVHRSFSVLVLAVHLAAIYQLRKAENSRGLLGQLANALLVMVIAEVITGIIMAYFSVPALAQPIHLLLAIVMLGFQFVALLIVNAGRFLQNQAVPLPQYTKV